MVYVNSLDYNIFETNILKNLLTIRDNYNTYFSETREIKLIFPDVVVKERYKQETQKILSTLETFRSAIKGLDETSLIKELDKIIPKIRNKIIYEGEKFLEEKNIEEIPTSINDYIDRIIDKKIHDLKPFTVVFDKKGEKYEKGFLDAVIWYSIIDYTRKQIIIDPEIGYENETDFYIFLGNDKDFDSEELKKEFLSETGKNIDILNFNGCTVGIDNQRFKELLEKILSNSKNNKIEQITIFFTKNGEKNTIRSVCPEPLNIDIFSLCPSEESFPSDNFENAIQPYVSTIRKKLGEFGFTIKDVQLSLKETNIIFVDVVLRDYKSWFLDILEINIYFADGTDITLEDVDLEINVIEFYENINQKMKIKKGIIELLDNIGYSNIDPNVIDFNVEEYVSDND